ncbi:MAG: zinc dependent phospholipase C family protein [Deltaproteobacteria bacterium]|nr:zinc dependent phospholipase C family protein [Deltaproteobacteria bacterium]
MLYLALLTFATLMFFPSEACAWGPVAHLHFAETILSQAAHLPQFLRNIITQFPLDYYYGAIAADITLGKKFVEYEHNCHSWKVGIEILEKSNSEATRAFSYGYLTHLGADTISHNYFVPYHLIASFRSRIHRHIYWEMRYDTMLQKPELATMARDLAKKGKYLHHDQFLDTILKRTLFSFKTNRRIFSGLILLHDLDYWQKATGRLVHQSKWELSTHHIQEFKKLAVHFIMDFLTNFRDSHSILKDPSGYEALSFAKKKRAELKKLYRRKEIKDEDVPHILKKIKLQLKKRLLT